MPSPFQADDITTDTHATQTTREELGVDAESLFFGDVSLVEDDDHRTAELGDLRGEEEIAEQVRRVDDQHHRVRAAISGDVA